MCEGSTFKSYCGYEIISCLWFIQFHITFLLLYTLQVHSCVTVEYKGRNVIFYEHKAYDKKEDETVTVYTISPHIKHNMLKVITRYRANIWSQLHKQEKHKNNSEQ